MSTNSNNHHHHHNNRSIDWLTWFFFAFHFGGRFSLFLLLFEEEFGIHFFSLFSLIQYNRTWTMTTTTATTKTMIILITSSSWKCWFVCLFVCFLFVLYCIPFCLIIVIYNVFFPVYDKNTQLIEVLVLYYSNISSYIYI